jgi:transposase
MVRIDELEKENKELKSMLAQNSKNSNRPPSSDGLKKRPAFPRKKGKRTGGQKGHKGKTLEMVHHPDHVIKHAPIKCRCGQSLKRVLKHTVERRQIFDLPEPKLEVTEHQIQGCACPNCRRINVGEFPEAAPSRVQYGNGVRALSVLLNIGLNMPLGKVRQFFADI